MCRLFLSGDHGLNKNSCGHREYYNIHPFVIKTSATSLCNMLPLGQLEDCLNGMKRDDNYDPRMETKRRNS